MAILHTKTGRGTVVPYTYNETGERTIQHMEACGWINAQRGQNCIHLTYDGIHYNALILNKEHTQTENVTLNVGVDLKEKSKRKYNPPEAANTTHLEPTQANVINDRTGTNDNTKPANDTLNTDLGNKDKRKRECDLPNTSADKKQTRKIQQTIKGRHIT